MDRRVLSYIKDKNTWVGLGNLAAQYLEGINGLKSGLNKAYGVMKKKNIPAKEIEEWTASKQSLIKDKEKSLDTIKDAYSYLDAHLGDAIELRRIIKKIGADLSGEVLNKSGEVQKELMSHQQEALNNAIKLISQINKESEEIVKLTKHNI